MKPFILKIAKLDGRTVTITEIKGIPAGKKETTMAISQL